MRVLIKRGLLYLVIGASFFSLFTTYTQPAFATITDYINFQGKITNPDGTNLSNGSYNFVFSIYTVASGGSNVWTESKSLTITDGLFQTNLGDTTTLPGSVNFNSNSLYLGIKVGADAEMTPRVQLTAAPQAFNSDNLGGIASTGYVQLGQSASAQSDASTNSSIFINKTAAGNIIELQNTAVDVFTVANNGNVTLGQNAAQAINVAQTTTNAAGQNLTITAGKGGAGAAANNGGNLVLQAGAGNGTNGNGGNITLAAGALNGTGVVGSVIIKNPSDSATAFQIQNAAGTITLFQADTQNNRLYVGSSVASATPTLLVLANKNTSGDPTGVAGGHYYSSYNNAFRCYQNGVWHNCIGQPIISERRTAELLPVGLAATVTTGYGMTIPTVNGAATSSPQVEDNYVNWASAAVLNSVGGYTPAVFTTMRTEYSPKVYARIRVDPGAVTTARYWIALASAALNGSDGTGQYIGLRYSTSAADPSWECASSDGATPSVTATGVTITAGHYYDIVIDLSNAGTLNCSVADNGGAYTTVSKATNLPAIVTNLGVETSVTTLAAAARNISLAYLGMEYQ